LARPACRRRLDPRRAARAQHLGGLLELDLAIDHGDYGAPSLVKHRASSNLIPLNALWSQLGLYGGYVLLGAPASRFTRGHSHGREYLVPARDPADRRKGMSAPQQDVRSSVAMATLPKRDLAPCCVPSAKECPRAAA